MLWHGKNFRGIINKAKQMIFDNTGTTLSSTNAEDAIKEVNSNLSKPIDTSNQIATLSPFTTYTAVQECYAIVRLIIVGQGGTYSCSSHLLLNNVIVMSLGSQGLATGTELFNTQTFHLLEGDIIKISKSNAAPDAQASIFGVR